MKKLFTFLLIFLSAFFLLTFTQVNASLGDITEIAGARYYEEEIIESNKLDYGVTHTKAKAFTSTSYTGYDADGYGGFNDAVVAGKYYPQIVNVIEVPTTSGAKVVNWANLNNHKWTLTTIRNMIKDYESKHPGWRVVAATNGDFFDIGAKGNLPYQTSNAVVNDGEFYKISTGSNVGFTNDGTANSLIGNVTAKKTTYMKLAVYDASGNIINTFDIQKRNTAPGANETAVYYATYDTTQTIVPIQVDLGTSNGYFVDSADLALPNNDNDFYGKGTITSTVSKTISTGQFAIVTNNPEVSAALAVGVKIRAQWEYTGALATAKTVAGVGSTIMKDGVIANHGMPNRAPRTVIGKKADGTIVMMVVDGRQAAQNMFGADGTELAAIMKSYGAVDAYNLDGGGSSTSVVRKGNDIVVMNSPSDGRERTDANALLVVTRDPEYNYEISQKTENSLTLNVDLQETYTHRIDKLVARVNLQYKDVVDGKVTFTGLRPNKEYKVELFYRTSTGVLYQIVFEDNVSTLKRPAIFRKIDLLENDTSFTFTPNVYDQDQATNLLTAQIFVNGTEYHFVNGKLELNKTEISEITEVKLIYTYDLGDGNSQTFEIINPHFYSTMTLNVILDSQNTFVVGIYK